MANPNLSNGHNARTWRRRKGSFLKGFHHQVGKSKVTKRLAARRSRRMQTITDEEVERAWQAYALAHFQLRNSKPTDLERKGMRAALASREQSK